MVGSSSKPQATPFPVRGEIKGYELGLDADLVVHALGVKEIASVAELAELTPMECDDVAVLLVGLERAGLAVLQGRRQLWRLTQDGVERHRRWISAAMANDPGVAGVRQSYDRFLVLNVTIKGLCGEWQVRDGAPNDHGDGTYDSAVVEQLRVADDEADHVLADMSEALPRLGVYRPRLSAALDRLEDGQLDAFTGVLCDSYHDIWMDLHQDLVITLGVDRRTEGSF
jgi:hypothetical protein